MKLFKVVKWQLVVSEEAWGLLPFKKLLDRDKSKEKVTSMKELLFVYYWCDVKSNYLHMKDDEKLTEIRRDVGLSDKWKFDEHVKAAIDFYINRSRSVIEQLYIDSLISAQAIGSYLRNTEALLAERDQRGMPVYDIAKLTSANERVPKLMANLKAAYKEVVKEQEDNENKKKGSKAFNIFEEGFVDNAL